MALVVEDGTGLSAADSYVSAADFETYAAAYRPVAAADDPAEVDRALRVATAWIDATYEPRFPGYRLNGRDQARAWPRQAAYLPGRVPLWSDVAAYRGDYLSVGGYYYIPPDEVPREILVACKEAALRELATPNSLSPDLKMGGAIRRVQAGSVAVEYASGASPHTTWQTIEQALATLLMPSNPYSGRVVRV
jgi:hypothetical protein